MEKEVDRYRGMPGFYWGIWALIQATISQIDFNYAECKLSFLLFQSSYATKVFHLPNE